ncbi:hypothetical protein BASA81_012556 [Batrachochytrium salamandrivorans]|nr:hypothetical protein BASA81_012556 [Batrachochytrium salamandrivorans]
MKSLVLLKQRALYGEEKEDARYLELKQALLDLKPQLTKTQALIKAWLDHVRAIITSSRELAGGFSQGGEEDRDLSALTVQLETDLNNTNSGLGLVEVALDSVNRKLELVGELRKRVDKLAALHLELSRANRKAHSDPAKHEQERVELQTAYTTSKTDLVAQLEFVHSEIQRGFLVDDLEVVKQAQRAFFETGSGATSQFAPASSRDLAGVWTRFTERQASATSASLLRANSSTSGRNLFKQGMRGDEEKSGMAPPPPPPSAASAARMGSSTRLPPPPPPPPPPAQAASFRAPVFDAVYAYEAVNSDELSFEVGDRLALVNKTDESWWEMRDALGNTGMVPSNYLVQV